jgi:hypothetical protein
LSKLNVRVLIAILRLSHGKHHMAAFLYEELVACSEPRLHAHTSCVRYGPNLVDPVHIMRTLTQIQAAETDQQIETLRGELDATRRAYRKLYKQTDPQRHAGQSRAVHIEALRDEAELHTTKAADTLPAPVPPGSYSSSTRKVPRPPSRTPSSSSSVSAFAEDESRRIAQLRRRLWSSVSASQESPVQLGACLQAEDLGSSASPGMRYG